MVDLLSVQYLTPAAAWPDVPQLEDGWWPTGGPVSPGSDNGLMNWQARELTARTNLLKKRIDDLTTRADATVTVGAGGDFATMSAALSFMSDRRQSFVSGGAATTLRLLTGYVMREQILVRGVQLSWINIIADDPQVTIDRSYLTTQFSGAYPAFAAAEVGSTPTLTALFSMSAGGASAGRHGIMLTTGSFGRIRPGGGIKTAGDCGAHISQGASLDGAFTSFAGAAAVGCYVETMGMANVNSSDLSLCQTGISALAGARVCATSVDVTQHAVNGVLAQKGSHVTANNASCRRAGADLAADLVVATGSVISAGGATGGVSQTVNTPTASGVIYK